VPFIHTARAAHKANNYNEGLYRIGDLLYILPNSQLVAWTCLESLLNSGHTKDTCTEIDCKPHGGTFLRVIVMLYDKC